MGTERKTFGKTISTARKARGWSLVEVCRRVVKEDGKPITPQYLNDIEHDRRIPIKYIIIRMAEALNLDADLLQMLAGQTIPEFNQFKEYLESNPEAAPAVAKAFRKIISEAMVTKKKHGMDH